jgi:hypothetical protein
MHVYEDWRLIASCNTPRNKTRTRFSLFYFILIKRYSHWPECLSLLLAIGQTSGGSIPSKGKRLYWYPHNSGPPKIRNLFLQCKRLPLTTNSRLVMGSWPLYNKSTHRICAHTYIATNYSSYTNWSPPTMRANWTVFALNFAWIRFSVASRRRMMGRAKSGYRAQYLISYIVRMSSR